MNTLVRELLDQSPRLTYAEIARRAGISRSRVGEIARSVRIERGVEEWRRDEAEEPILDRDPYWLPISTRAHNALKNLNIKRVGELQNYSPTELLKVKNLGQKSLSELVAVLHVYGVRLKPPPPLPIKVPVRRCPYCGGTGRLANYPDTKKL